MGVLMGLVVGTLPGLTSVMAVSLITPLTFKMDPVNGFGMLLGVYNSAIFSGGISAIAINTPGTPASIATTFDGYKISKRGRTGFALGVNTIYSVMGGIFSTVALMIACEPLASFALKFGSAEYFWLAIFGLSMMISISHVALAKGLVVGALGLLLSTIGLDPMLGSKRFVGGNVALLDGISFIPVLIGLFGIGEMLYQIFENVKESKKEDIAVVGKKDRVLPTKAEHRRMALPAFIGSIIGVVVGIVPGTEKFKDLVKLDEAGYIVAGEDGITSEPGIFAAGDIRTKNLRQVVTAVADGANAVASAQRYLLDK